MRTIKAWWSDVLDQVNSYDAGDLLAWRHGAMCEDELALMVSRGEDPNGHSFDMPMWMQQQLHFENLVYTLIVRLRYAIGKLLCCRGHWAVEIDESAAGPDCPCVDWYCKCCGDGGRNWW